MALTCPSPQMILWFACWWFLCLKKKKKPKKPSHLMLVCIPGHPYMYPYLSIFSYKVLWNWNQNTVANNEVRSLWKISFEVLNFLLQGWPQLHFLYFLMARTAGMFKKRFQVISLLLCIVEFWFFDIAFEFRSFFFVYETGNYPSFKFINLLNPLDIWYSQLTVPKTVLSSQT